MNNSLVAQNNTFQVFLKTLTGMTITLDIDSKDTFSSIKIQMFNKYINLSRETDRLPVTPDDMRWIVCGEIITENNFSEKIKLLPGVNTTHLIITSTQQSADNIFLNTIVTLDCIKIRDIMRCYIKQYNEYKNITQIITKDTKQLDIETMKNNIHTSLHDIYYLASDIPDELVKKLYDVRPEIKEQYRYLQSNLKTQYKTSGRHIWNALDQTIKKVLKLSDISCIKIELRKILSNKTPTFNLLFIEGIRTQLNKTIANIQTCRELGGTELELESENKIIENYNNIIQLAVLYTPNYQAKQFEYTLLYDQNGITDICDPLLYDISVQSLD